MVEKDIVYLYEHLKRVEKRALDELYRSVRGWDELYRSVRALDELSRSVRALDELYRSVRALDELYRSVSQRANKIIFTDNVRIYFVYLVMIKIRNSCQILSIE
jgi:uncharacterized protein YjiS (DUF1127 family)